MKLYYSPGTSALAPHIALCESGLAFEPVLVNIRTHQLPDGSDYYAIQPLGYVPLLELDDGERLHEIAAILQYVADQTPAGKLAPANGTLLRYHLQEWLHFVGTELHKGGYSPLFNRALPDEAKGVFRERLLSRYQWVEGQLQGRDYLMGDQFSVADGYLFTATRWAAAVKLDISGLTNVQAFQARMMTRPGVLEALRAHGLEK
jgi:glutathione S-transferase